MKSIFHLFTCLRNSELKIIKKSTESKSYSPSKRFLKLLSYIVASVMYSDPSSGKKLIIYISFNNETSTPFTFKAGVQREQSFINYAKQYKVDS